MKTISILPYSVMQNGKVKQIGDVITVNIDQICTWQWSSSHKCTNIVLSSGNYLFARMTPGALERLIEKAEKSAA